MKRKLSTVNPFERFVLRRKRRRNEVSAKATEGDNSKRRWKCTCTRERGAFFFFLRRDRRFRYTSAKATFTLVSPEYSIPGHLYPGVPRSIKLQRTLPRDITCVRPITYARYVRTRSFYYSLGNFRSLCIHTHTHATHDFSFNFASIPASPIGKEKNRKKTRTYATISRLTFAHGSVSPVVVHRFGSPYAKYRCIGHATRTQLHTQTHTKHTYTYTYIHILHPYSVASLFTFSRRASLAASFACAPTR